MNEQLVADLHRQVLSLSKKLEGYELKFEALTNEVEVLYGRLSGEDTEEYLTLQQAMQFVKKSAETIKYYRKNKIWIQDIHFVRRGTRGVLYRKEILRVWLEYSRSNPQKYKEAIEVFIANRDKMIRNLKKAK